MIGIYEIDIETDRFIHVAQGVYEGLGYAREEVEGELVERFLTQESQELWRQRREQMKAGVFLDSQIKYVCIAKDGSRIPVVIEAFYRIDKGRITGAIVAVREIKNG